MMAKIKPKRSYTANAVPTTSDLDANELAINWADGKAFTKNAAGNIVSITLGGSGGGGAAEDARWEYFKPAAPTGVTATASNAQAVVSWTAPAIVVPPVTDYTVQFSTNGGTTWTTATDTVSTATTATITGLTNGSAHVFRVAAVNGIGTGAYSTQSAAVTPTAGDPLFGSVALLLHMDGTGNTFVDSSPLPKTITANGNATQSATQSKFGGKSAAFDGSGDYLSITDNGNGLALGTGDFVYEWWFRSTATNAYAAMVTRPYDSPGGILFSLNGPSGNGRPEIFWREFENAQLMQSDAGGFNDNNWHHFAFVRSGTTCSMYIDGIRRGTRTGVSTSVPTSTIVVGGDIQFGGRDFSGHIDELRITRGNDRGYTGATIIVPTAEFLGAEQGTDPLLSSVALLLRMDGTGNMFVDSSATPKTVTAAGNATQSTAQSKFGGKSGLFDGDGDYLTAGSIPFSTSDFVIEGWFYLTSSPPGGTFTTLFSHRPDTSSVGGACLVMNGSSLLYFIAGASGWQVTGSSTGLSVSANTWMHIALVRSGNQCRAYLNGTGGNVASVSGAIGTSGSFSIMAGAADGGQAVAGYCDDFRVTVGNNRGYTGATIPVPSAAFPGAGSSSAPTAVRNLRMTSDEFCGYALNEWDAPLSDGGIAITGYRIVINGVSSTQAASVRTRVVDTGGSAAPYSITVYAVNAAGESTAVTLNSFTGYCS
jgi:hypothetical protein